MFASRFFPRRPSHRPPRIAVTPPAQTLPAQTLTPPASSGREGLGSLVELLATQADRFGDQTAFRFLHDTSNESTLSFRELEARAQAIAARLSETLEPGDRALLVYPPGLEFVCAFFGCLYAGVVATPATYPKPRRPLPRMSRIAEDSGARVALTTASTLAAIDFERQDDAARSLDWLATDEFESVPANFRAYEATSESLAFLQYTSGSTSEPKGVMVSHGNLLANLEAIRGSFGLPAEPEPEQANGGVFWLPAYHDMGLIGGVLTPLYVGGPSILMPPPAFLQRPLRWLEAIDRFKASISGAPDFAYRLCVERTTDQERAKLDLSHWRVAFCGAEPIHASTLTAFADAMEPAGFTPDAFYPCYGLAEATLLAAGPDALQPPTLLEVDRAELGAGRAVMASSDRPTQQLVGCGRAPVDHELYIVDPNPTEDGRLQRLEERHVGEIVVAGPSVTQGYWQRDEQSSASFGVSLVGCDRTVLRTGDLGFLDSGELFVTGRCKDVVILRGRNYYPQDLEQTAESSHPLVMPAAAFSVASSAGSEERLVLVCQIDRSCRSDDRAAVVEAIRRAVLVEHEVDPMAVVLIRQGSLPVTSSGKVQRNLCRERYLADDLRTLFQWHSGSTTLGAKRQVPDRPDLEGLSTEAAAEKIEAWMFAWLADRVDLDLAQADRNLPFAEQGLDSLTAVELSAELEVAFSVPLPPVVAWNYPTPASMSHYLAEQCLGAEATSPNATNMQAEPGLANSDADDIEALLADIENLSDEEAARLLDEE